MELLKILIKYLFTAHIFYNNNYYYCYLLLLLFFSINFVCMPQYLCLVFVIHVNWKSSYYETIPLSKYVCIYKCFFFLT